jgi:hypothetical protein
VVTVQTCEYCCGCVLLSVKLSVAERGDFEDSFASISERFEAAKEKKSSKQTHSSKRTHASSFTRRYY